jgi:putative NADH-flavin reductase
MKIIIFGASGRLGKYVVQQALEAGHLVTAFVRTPSKLGIEHDALTVLQGDITHFGEVEQAIAGQEAVISVLGPTRPLVPGMMELAAKNIVSVMQAHHIKRLISITGAGVRDPQDQPGLFDRAMKALLTLMAGEVLRDSQANVNLIRFSSLDWTIVRFPRLLDGPHTGKYRVGYVGKGSGIKISRADGADFILKELGKNEYIHKMPLVSY